MTEDNAPLIVENFLLTLKNQVQKSKKYRDYHDEAVGESATTSTLPQATSKKTASNQLERVSKEGFGEFTSTSTLKKAYAKQRIMFLLLLKSPQGVGVRLDFNATTDNIEENYLHST